MMKKAFSGTVVFGSLLDADGGVRDGGSIVFKQLRTEVFCADCHASGLDLVFEVWHNRCVCGACISRSCFGDPTFVNEANDMIAVATFVKHDTSVIAEMFDKAQLPFNEAKDRFLSLEKDLKELQEATEAIVAERCRLDSERPRLQLMKLVATGRQPVFAARDGKVVLCAEERIAACFMCEEIGRFMILKDVAICDGCGKGSRKHRMAEDEVRKAGAVPFDVEYIDSLIKQNVASYHSLAAQLMRNEHEFADKKARMDEAKAAVLVHAGKYSMLKLILAISDQK